jgi:hypothetical protein
MHSKFYKNYSSSYIFPIDYYINFITFEQVKHPVKK